MTTKRLGAAGTRGTMWKTASASPPSGGRPRLVADHTHKEPCTKIARAGTVSREVSVFIYSVIPNGAGAHSRGCVARPSARPGVVAAAAAAAGPACGRADGHCDRRGRRRRERCRLLPPDGRRRGGHDPRHRRLHSACRRGGHPLDIGWCGSESFFPKPPNGPEFAVDGTGTCPTDRRHDPLTDSRRRCWLCAGDAQVAPLRSRCHERQQNKMNGGPFSTDPGLHFTSSRCAATQPHGRALNPSFEAQRQPVGVGEYSFLIRNHDDTHQSTRIGCLHTHTHTHTHTSPWGDQRWTLLNCLRETSIE